MGEEYVLKHLQFLNNHNLCANVSNIHTHFTKDYLEKGHFISLNYFKS